MLLSKFKRLIAERRLPDFKYWSQNYKKLLVQKTYSNSTFWNLISIDPVIIYTMPFSVEYNSLYSSLDGQKAYILFSNPWIPRNLKQAKQLKQEADFTQKKHSNLNFIYLCNDNQEAETLQEVGLRAYFCNQNCFLDETIFQVKPEVTKQFDALYDAQIVAYKRHHLAEEVDNLALNGYISSITENKEYTSYVKTSLVTTTGFKTLFNKPIMPDLQKKRFAPLLTNAE